MLRTIVAAVVALAASAAPTAAEPPGARPTPAAVEAAREALELHYIQRKIYRPVRCQSKNVGADAFVLCGPAPIDRQTPGGLFVVTLKAGAPDVAPVNGKARSHVEGAGRLQSADGKPVTVSDVMRPSPDIPAVLNAF